MNHFTPADGFPVEPPAPSPIPAYDDHPLRHTDGPFFVACLPNECKGMVMGPLFRFDWAYLEAQGSSSASNGCENGHLIGRTVGPSTEVHWPPVYGRLWEEDRTAVLAGQEETAEWLLTRLRTLGQAAVGMPEAGLRDLLQALRRELTGASEAD